MVANWHYAPESSGAAKTIALWAMMDLQTAITSRALQVWKATQWLRSECQIATLHYGSCPQNVCWLPPYQLYRALFYYPGLGQTLRRKVQSKLRNQQVTD